VVVRGADVAHLALAHQVVEGAQRLLERGLAIVPVRLVEIDVVRLQPAQRVLDTVHDVLARKPRVVRSRSHRSHHLGGDERGVTILARGQPLPEHDLGLAAGIAGGPARIDVGGVDEVAAGLEVGVEDRLRGFLVRRPSEGIAAEAESGHSKAGTTELAHEHEGVSFGLRYAGEPTTIRSWSAERI